MFESGYSLINGSPSGGNVSNGGANRVPARAAACASCPRGCKMRLASADSNEAVCAGTMFASIGGGGMFGGGGAKPGANAMPSALSQKLTRQANDLMHKYGLGHWQLMATRGYIDFLDTKGHHRQRERNRSRSAARGHFRLLRGAIPEDLVARGSFRRMGSRGRRKNGGKTRPLQGGCVQRRSETDLLGDPGTLFHAGRGGMGLSVLSSENAISCCT